MKELKLPRARLSKIGPSDDAPIRYTTLTELLRDENVQLLTADRKLDSWAVDPVVTHLYESRGFKGVVYLCLLTIVALMIVLSWYSFDRRQDRPRTLQSLALYGLGPFLFVLIVCFARSKHMS